MCKECGWVIYRPSIVQSLRTDVILAGLFEFCLCDPSIHPSVHRFLEISFGVDAISCCRRGVQSDSRRWSFFRGLFTEALHSFSGCFPVVCWNADNIWCGRLHHIVVCSLLFKILCLFVAASRSMTEEIVICDGQRVGDGAP